MGVGRRWDAGRVGMAPEVTPATPGATLCLPTEDEGQGGEAGSRKKRRGGRKEGGMRRRGRRRGGKGGGDCRLSLGLSKARLTGRLVCLPPGTDRLGRIWCLRPSLGEASGGCLGSLVQPWGNDCRPPGC